MLLYRPATRPASFLCCCMLWLAACTQAPPPRPVVVPPAPMTPAPSSRPAPLAEDLLHYESEPETTASLEADPLFRILSAEFAGQRDQLPYAVTQYGTLAASSRDPALAERATRIALFANDAAAALVAAQRWVSLAPDNLDARQIAAALHVRQGQVAPAVTHLEYFLAHDRSPEEVKLRTVANLLGREQDKATALAVMEQIIADRTTEADTLLLYAVLALRAKDLDSSRQAMAQLVEKADIKPAIALAYVSALQEEGKRQEAIDFLAKALARTPDEAGLRLLYARSLAEVARFEEARTEFLALQKQDGDNPEIRFALGLLGIETRRLDEAEAQFRALIDSPGQSGNANFYLGQIAELKDDKTAALAHYAQVTEGDSLLQAELRAALLKAGMGKVEEALNALDALKPGKGEPERQFTLVKAEILINAERLEEAMALFDLALNGDYDGSLLYARAMLAERMGRLDLLEHDLQEVLKHEPENAEALNALGYTLADRGQRLDEAKGYIEKALKLSPDSFYILDSMGWVLFRLGRPEEAVGYLEKAQALRNDPEVAAHLGEVLWALGRRDEARAVWDAVLKEQPDEPRILKVRQRLDP